MGLDQLACFADFYGGLLFIPGEHPNSDVSVHHGLNSVSDALLELVFDGR